MYENGYTTKNTGFDWDARELYLKEAVLRGHIVLDSNKRNISEWYEALCDFFDWTACIFEDDKDKEKNLIVDVLHQELESIEKLIYAVSVTIDNKKKTFTETERKERKEQAYDKMRKIFRKINLAMWKKGLYVPKKRMIDPNKAINQMH